VERLRETEMGIEMERVTEPQQGVRLTKGEDERLRREGELEEELAGEELQSPREVCRSPPR